MTVRAHRNVRDRVSYGARQLDQVRPGWEGEIDIDRLNIGDGYRCVAGQLVGHFGSYNKLGIEGTEIANGMMSARGGFRKTVEYYRLTVAWKREILSRLNKDVRPVPGIMARFAWRLMFPLLRFA